MRKIKVTRKFSRHISAGLILYLVLTFPLVAVTLKSEYIRFIATQTITHWKGKSLGVDNIFIGDSITAAGRNWGSPFTTINLAANGYTVWQVNLQLNRTKDYKATNLFILAGTNDVIGLREFNLDQFEEDYTQLLDKALESGLRTFVTEIPFTVHEKHNRAIASANRIIRKLTLDKGITCVDLNSIIAPNGILLGEYSLDGVHLNPSAYTQWRTLLRDAIENPKSNH